MEKTIEIPVRSTEVDFLGHVNNAKYLEYMEWGREDWIKQAGYSFDDLYNRGIGTVTVNINIDYLGECYKGDILEVKTRPVKLGNTSIVVEQAIYKKDSGKKVSKAHVTVVFIDMETRKSMPIPAFLKDILQPR